MTKMKSVVVVGNEKERVNKQERGRGNIRESKDRVKKKSGRKERNI